MHLRRRRHVGDGVEMVHLVHGHGHRGRGEADGEQGVRHHHEGQVYPCGEHGHVTGAS